MVFLDWEGFHVEQGAANKGSVKPAVATFFSGLCWSVEHRRLGGWGVSFLVWLFGFRSPVYFFRGHLFWSCHGGPPRLPWRVSLGSWECSCVPGRSEANSELGEAGERSPCDGVHGCALFIATSYCCRSGYLGLDSLFCFGGG